MDKPSDSKAYNGTRAHRPDLDWSQVRETVLMLELVSGQIMASMRDSDSSVDVLANTFTSMAGYVRTLSEMIRQMPTGPDDAGQKAALTGIADQVGSMINQAVVAFQFYDKLVQRLSHVTFGLKEVSDLVGDKSRLYNPEEWVEVQNRFRGKFSTQEEHALFEAVLSGVPVDEALQSFMSLLKDKGNEVELF
jgi:hypothetical protein